MSSARSWPVSNGGKALAESQRVCVRDPKLRVAGKPYLLEVKEDPVRQRSWCAGQTRQTCSPRVFDSFGAETSLHVPVIQNKKGENDQARRSR